MRRSTFLAALLLAAMAWGGDAQVVSCPYTSPSWNLVQSTPAVIPQGANCSTSTIYTVFEYWTPELSGSTLNTSSGTNPTPPQINVGPPVPRDAAGNVLSGSGVSCQWFASFLGAFPAPTTVPPPTSQLRTCGNLAAANAAALPTGTVVGNATADSPAECCRRCTNTIACKQFAYANNVTAVNVTCLLFSSVTTVNTTAPLTVFVGYSAGWGSSVVQCTGSSIGDIRSVVLPLTSGTPAYTQLCSNGSTQAIRPPDTSITIPVAAPADAPVANVSSLTVNNVCSTATAVTGTFFYAGSNIAGATTFNVTLNGAACTPGAASLTNGNSNGTTVQYTCNVAGGVPAGALNVSLTASYSGSQTTGGCTGVKTVSASASGTSTTAPTASLAAASAPPTVCTGNTQIIADFVYNSTAANTTFAATSSPASTCTVSPLNVVGGSTSAAVRVTCTKAAPGFAAGNVTVTLAATYTGSAPCIGSNTTTASATVAVVNAESGVSVTTLTAPEKCAPTKSVAATFRFNATNVGTISFAATSPGLSCTADPTPVSGSTGSVSVVVAATCTSAADIPAGTVPITLTATYQGQGPCAGGSASGIANVKIDPTPTVTVAPVGTPADDCFGAQSVVEDFRVTVANGATNTALTAQLAGVFNCTVTPAIVPANGVVSVSCTNPAGFPSGKHNLTIQGTASGPAGACAGSYSASSYTTINVLPAPELKLTPITPDEPICAGDASVSVTWRYQVTGTVAGTPVVTTATTVTADNNVTCVLGAPVGTPTQGTVTAVCTNLPTTNAELDITLTMTTTQPGCGTVTADATNTYSVACCLYNATGYAKVADNNPNPPFCYSHQRPNNLQTRSCPFYYGWFNQGPTTSDVADVDSVSHVVAMADPSSPGCATVTEVADITAVCEGPLDIPGTGATPRAPPSQGTNVLKITISGYKYSDVRTFVYAGCPNPRNGNIPLSNTTCSSTINWRPYTYSRYAPRTVAAVAPGRGASLEFRIPIARTGGCTCANLYWTVVQTGLFKGVPCPAAP